jgi:hypothetical protein
MRREIKFFCEGKAPTHRRVDLRDGFGDKDVWRERGRVGRRRSHGEVILQRTSRLRGERDADGWLDHDKPVGRELLCPTCGRNPLLSEEKLNLLHSAGIAEVDISRLPF